MASLLIIVPLLGIVLLNLPVGFVRRLAFPLALTMAFVQGVLAIFLPANLWNRVLVNFLGWGSFGFTVDRLSVLLLLCISIVMFSALLVGWVTTRESNRQFEFANLLIISVTGMNGIVMVRDLFSLYIFIEVAAIASFIMISLHREKQGLEGAFKYLMLSAVATLMMLTGIALLLMTTGHTSFYEVAMALHGTSNSLTQAAVAVFIGGLCIKAGMVPFHGWLPDAYTSAPPAVTIILGGILTKTTGAYTLIRLVSSVFGFTPQIKVVLLFVGSISIVVGALAALGQRDFKRMLAYSSISQVGYILLGLGTGTALGLAGGIFHLFNHTIFKTQLFVNAAAVEEQTGTRDMDIMGGLSARMPVTGATSVIAFLSTAGIPPLAGFWSKLIIIVAVWMAGYRTYAVVAVLASIVTCAYLLSMQRRVFFGTLAEQFKQTREASFGILIPELLLALITIGVGVLFPQMLNAFILPITRTLG